MHSILSFALPLALAGSALANPLMRRDDACLAAVTGAAALGDPSLRRDHCSSFLSTIVTPAATTVTVTVTDAPSPTDNAWNGWKRDVTVCPNEVPNYASACNTAGYKSACSVWGITGETTITIPATTTTKSVYLAGVCTSTAVITSTVSACSGGTTTVTATVGTGSAVSGTSVFTTTVTSSVGTVTSTSTSTSTSYVYVGQGSVSTSTSTSTTTATIATTSTVTSTVSASAVTVTVTADPSVTPGSVATTTPVGASGTCLSAAQATAFVNAFTTLLEYTSYNGTAAPPGRGYQYNVSAQYLAADFQDYSDSINWMAGFPLNTVTFNGRAAFDYGQGLLQPELTMTTLNIDFSCKTVHWRWSALTSSYANIHGINYMTITDDLTQIQTNYAEFNNADWIQSFAPYNPSISCVVPGGLTKSAKRSMPHTY